MAKNHRLEGIILFVGDLAALVISLLILLWIRFGNQLTEQIFNEHVRAFSGLFLIWVLVLFAFGLYRKQTLVFKRSLPQTLLKAQITNSILAVLYFYLTPYFGIAPKTNLVIYLLVSYGVLFLWRLASHGLFAHKKRQKGILLASGAESEELAHEINNNSHYDMEFVATFTNPADIQGSIKDYVRENNISVVVYDSRNEALKPLANDIYELILSDVAIFELDSLYESIFDRIPLQHLDHHWFLENVTDVKPKIYDLLKRITDIVISIPLTIVFAVLYPFIWILIKIQDGGDILIYQERVGRKGEVFKLCKIRTMNMSDSGFWIKEGTENQVTKVGSFLRKTRLDELPQVYSILKGDLSFIGPRPDMVNFEKRLAAELPHYKIRTMATPGLSGWAQVNQDIQPQSIEENRVRLSYDFFYIKNRSFVLDMEIALRTIRTLLSRLG